MSGSGTALWCVAFSLSISRSQRLNWLVQVFKLLIDTYTSGGDSSLNTLSKEWIESQGRIQQIPNPSGTITSGGLGEPKFQLNETAFTGAWGTYMTDIRAMAHRPCCSPIFLAQVVLRKMDPLFARLL